MIVQYQFVVDNFTGWRRVSFLLRNMQVLAGSLETCLASVSHVQLLGSGIAQGTTFHIDRMIVDVCPSIPVKKLSMEGLYLENQLEESPDPTDVLEIADDNQTIKSQSSFPIIKKRSFHVCLNLFHKNKFKRGFPRCLES